MIRRLPKILLAVFALSCFAGFALRAQDGEVGIIKVLFDYTSEQGAQKCGNAGAYSVFIRTGEKEDEGVRIDAIRDTRQTTVIPEGAGVTASAEKGEQDRLILTIKSAVTGTRDITVRQYLPVVIEGSAPDYEQTVKVDILRGKEVQLIVPVLKDQKPEIICPPGDAQTAGGDAKDAEPAKAKTVEKAIAEGKGGVVAVANYYKKSAQAAPVVSGESAGEGIAGSGGKFAPEKFTGALATGMEVVLDGAGSAPEGKLTYEWTQISGPPLKISDADKKTASFTPQKPGLYRIQLRVSNGKLTQYDGLEINIIGAISMRQEPRLMSVTEIDMPGDLVYMLKGKAVVVNRGQRAFQILDLSDPLNVKKYPVVTFESAGFKGFGKMYMSGSYLYATVFKGEDKNALAVLDFSLPEAPKLIGFADAPFVLPAIVVRENKLYTASPDGKNVKVMDVSGANTLKEVRNIAISLPPRTMRGGGLQLYGDGLIGSHNKDIFTIGMGDGKLKNVGVIKEEIEGFSLLAADGIVYVFSHVKGADGDKSVIWPYEFAGGGLKRLGEMQHEKGMIFKQLKSGDYLYLGRQLKEGMEIEFVDVGQPAKPVIVGRYHDEKAVISDFDVDGDLLVIVGNVDGKDVVLVMRESS